MSTRFELHPAAPELDEEAVVLEGKELDSAILGSTEDGKLIYDYDLLVEGFVEQGMSHDEAIEWISYNVEPLMGYGAGFVMCYRK
ncbi:MAG: hypothetical protein CMJ29_12440 [Phycisphaerae bacterium]|nr:hypothetical protein [Phycisphaerae bacterium]